MKSGYSIGFADFASHHPTEYTTMSKGQDSKKETKKKPEKTMKEKKADKKLKKASKK